MKRAPRMAILGAAAIGALACAPDLGTRDSLVTREQVLAIKGEPPEAAPGDDVTFTALVASPGGTVTDAPIAWAACAAPKPLGENDIVPPACLGEGDQVRPLGTSTSAPDAIRAALPADACALYGPDTPSGDYRPRDPDVTGGYYEPIRANVVSVSSGAAIDLERIACKLPSAPADVTTDFAARYKRNANPHLDVTVPVDQVAAGARVELTASWGPGDAETYVVFDPLAQAIVTRRESMRVAWFASAGEFDVDRTGRDEADQATSSANAWTAPAAAGLVHVWVVLRDSRGGIEFVAKDLAVAQK